MGKNKVKKLLLISLIFIFFPFLTSSAQENCYWGYAKGAGTYIKDCVRPAIKSNNDKCVGKERPVDAPDSMKDFACCCETSILKEGQSTLFKAPDIKITIPGMEQLSDINCAPGDTCEIPWLGQYIRGIYNYAIAIAGILAAVVLMGGGLLWLVSRGDASQVTKAKELIFGSITGMIILTGSYLILTLINSDLVNLKSISIETISPIMVGNEVSEDVTTDFFKCLYEKYGNSASEVKKKLTTVNFLGKNYQVNSSMAVALNNAQKQIDAAGITYKSTEPSGGAFNWRENRNKPTEQSLHSFGIAFDINPSRNPNYRSKTRPCKTDIPQNLINILKANGFRWGGEYKTVCDSMHFEWVKGDALCKIN